MVQGGPSIYVALPQLVHLVTQDSLPLPDTTFTIGGVATSVTINIHDIVVTYMPSQFLNWEHTCRLEQLAICVTGFNKGRVDKS